MALRENLSLFGMAAAVVAKLYHGLNELSRRAKDKSQVVSSEAQHVWIPTWLLQL